MSVAGRLRDALAEFGIPIEAVSHNGTEDTYMVFFIGAYAGNYMDDAPTTDTWEVSLHLIAPYTLNITQLRQQIRARLYAAGFTYPRVTDASNGKNSNDGIAQHIIFDCYYETGIAETEM